MLTNGAMTMKWWMITCSNIQRLTGSDTSYSYTPIHMIVRTSTTLTHSYRHIGGGTRIRTDPTLTDKENEAETQWEEAEPKTRRGGDRGATNGWLVELVLQEKKSKKLSFKKKPHRRKDERKTRNQQGSGSSAVRQVLKPPAPSSLSGPPPTPPPSLAEGESTWARDGVETRRNTAHTDGGWATDLACSPYGTPVEVSKVHLTKGGVGGTEGETTIF